MSAAPFLRLSLLASLALASCTSYQAQSGVIGGLVGAGLGAAFGDDHQDVVAGAAVGAAVGAGGAAVHEQSVRRRDYERYGIPPDSEAAPTAPPRETAPPRTSDPAPDPDYPVAQLTEDPNQVLSPFPPHHRIDITGFRSGQLAKDPQSGQIFRIP